MGEGGGSFLPLGGHLHHPAICTVKPRGGGGALLVLGHDFIAAMWGGRGSSFHFFYSNACQPLTDPAPHALVNSRGVFAPIIMLFIHCRSMARLVMHDRCFAKDIQGGGGISPGENFPGKISPLRKVAKFSPGEIFA